MAVQLMLVYIPVLQPIFETVALGPIQLALVVAASTLGFAAVEVEKWVRRRRTAAAAASSMGDPVQEVQP